VTVFDVPGLSRGARSIFAGIPDLPPPVGVNALVEVPIGGEQSGQSRPGGAVAV